MCLLEIRNHTTTKNCWIHLVIYKSKTVRTVLQIEHASCLPCFFTNLTLSFDGPVHLNSARKEKGPRLTFQNCFRYKSTSPKTYLTDQETKMSEETIKLSWNLRNSDQPNVWQMMAMHGWHALTGYQNHFVFFSHLVLVFQTYGTNYFPINV